MGERICSLPRETRYNGAVTKLLEKGIEAVRGLPADRQDMAGELLLSLAEAEPHCQLTPEQLDDVKLAVAEADRGEFASDADMAAIDAAALYIARSRAPRQNRHLYC
jgi:hypothetical protein